MESDAPLPEGSRWTKHWSNSWKKNYWWVWRGERACTPALMSFRGGSHARSELPVQEEPVLSQGVFWRGPCSRSSAYVFVADSGRVGGELMVTGSIPRRASRAGSTPAPATSAVVCLLTAESSHNRRPAGRRPRPARSARHPTPRRHHNVRRSRRCHALNPCCCHIAQC